MKVTARGKMIESTPKFINGVFPFTGRGYKQPLPLELPAYVVPSDKRAQLVYFRAGNSSNELIYLSLLKDGSVMRYFPIGAKASEHVSLAVVEDIGPDTKLEIMVGAAQGSAGVVVLDLGLLEI
jgi:hypothetical protein